MGTANATASQPQFIWPGGWKGDREDLKQAAGKRANNQDLRCLHTGQYIGGIDRHWGLMVTGPPRHKFAYTFIELHRLDLAGKYQVKDGLAIFTGSKTQGLPLFEKSDQKKPITTPIRFALNYDFLGDDVHFNLILRGKDGKYHYQRKWYRPTGDKGWEPLQEFRWTCIPRQRGEKTFALHYQGEWLYWPPGEKQPKRKVIDERIEYTNQDGKYWYKAKPTPDWASWILRPSTGTTQGVEEPHAYHLGTEHFGWARGFTFDDPPEWKEQ
jgi:hypothetical protein